MNNAPCKDCSNRQLHCHSSCEKYIAYQNLGKEIIKNRIEDNKMRGYISDSVFACKKKINKRR